MSELLKELFCMVGQTVELVQMIEHNLSVIVYKYSEYENPDKLYLAMQEWTMGHILSVVEQSNALVQERIQQLNNVLEFRNDIVHKFFKENNINKQSNNDEYLKNRCGYLFKRLSELDDLNQYLVQIIEMDNL